LGNVILVSGYGNIYKTEDGGYSWAEVARVPAQSKVIINPDNINLMYVAGRFNIHRSFDCGKSWGVVDYPFDVGTGVGDIELNIDSKGRILFPYGHEIYRSDNGGETWTVVEVPIRLVWRRYVLDEEKDLRYEFESRDGGKTWEKVLVRERTPDGWRWKSKVEDEEARPWLQLFDAPFPTKLAPDQLSSPVTGLAIDPNDDKIMYIGIAQYYEQDDLGIPPTTIIKTTDGGVTWLALPDDYEDIESIFGYAGIKQILINPQNPEVIYVRSEYYQETGIWKSVNGGKNWEPLVYLKSYPYSTTNEDILQLWRIYDNETAWKKARENSYTITSKYDRYPFPLPSINVWRGITLAMDTANGDYLLAGIADKSPGTDGRNWILLSVDGGYSWRELNLPHELEKAFADSIENQESCMLKIASISDKDSLTLYVGAGTQFYRATLRLSSIP
jgi:photosystem II stability/assembly factor-like uncharacterized protein